MKKSLAFLFLIILNSNIFALNLKCRNKVEGANYLSDLQTNYKLQEYSELLTIIDTSYLQVREALLDTRLIAPSSEGYGKIFCLLQNIFSLVLDFSQDIENQNVRDTVLVALSELASDLFQEVSIKRLKLAYPDKKFDFWEQFCAKESVEEKNKFLRSSLNSFDRNCVLNVVEEVFLILSYYLIECINVAVDHIKETMSFYFTKGKGKKKHTAAMIFGALANACMHVGQLINKPKQQGVLGLFATAFNTVSQITAVHADAEFEQLQIEEEQKGWFVNKVLSSKLTQAIISGVLSIVQNFLQEKLEEFLNYLSKKLIDLICQKTSEDQNGIIPGNQNINDGYFSDDEDD